MLMIGGTVYTISAYAIVLLTAMRKQRWIVGGCLISTILYIVLGKIIVEYNGLIGATYVYIISNTVLLMVFLIGLMIGIKSERTRDE